jgi:hypothetical protein
MRDAVDEYFDDEDPPLPYERIGRYFAIAIVVFFVVFLAFHVTVAILGGNFTRGAVTCDSFGNCY